MINASKQNNNKNRIRKTKLLRKEKLIYYIQKEKTQF